MTTIQLTKDDIQGILYSISEDAPEMSESASLAADLIDAMDNDFPDTWSAIVAKWGDENNGTI